MWPIVTDRVASSVSLSVTLVSPAETAQPIEMPSGLRIRVSSRKHVLDGGGHPPMGVGSFEGREGRPTAKYRDTVVICAKTAQLTMTPFWVVGSDWPRECV